MRNRLSAICALLTMAASPLAATAHGATIWTGTNYQVEVSAPTPVGTALFAVTLTVVGLNGAEPNAIISDGMTGITTVGNRLHQVWEAGIVPTPTSDLVVPANAAFYPIDSRFLVNGPDLPILEVPLLPPPTENRPIADATEAPNGGFGDSLTGNFTLVGAPSPTWDLAYLVLEAGAMVNLDFQIAAPGFTPEFVQTSFQIPEPTTGCLLAIGALGMGIAGMARRRRAG